RRDRRGDQRHRQDVRRDRQVPVERHDPERPKLLPLGPAMATGTRGRGATLAAYALLASLPAAGGCRRHALPEAAASPPRVVSLHDVTTEIVVALGAMDRLV